MTMRHKDYLTHKKNQARRLTNFLKRFIWYYLYPLDVYRQVGRRRGKCLGCGSCCPSYCPFLKGTRCRIHKLKWLPILKVSCGFFSPTENFNQSCHPDCGYYYEKE